MPANESFNILVVPKASSSVFVQTALDGEGDGGPGNDLMLCHLSAYA
jgi:hypothetical protein